MKKLKYLVILALPVFILTGCGRKTLTCESTIGTSKSTVKYEYRGKSLKNISSVTVLDFSNESELLSEVGGFEEYAKGLEEQTKLAYGDAKGITVSVKGDSSKKTITATLEVNPKEAKDVKILPDYVSGFDLNIDDAKKLLEGNGYTCKTK